MAAVSSNNAAVENISLVLPAADSICPEDFPDASYFPEVASAVDAAFCALDGESSDGVRGTWGLLAAVLGSAKNCSRFAGAFAYGYKDQKRNISLPGMIQILEQWRGYEQKKQAREQWACAKADFLQALDDAERRLDELTSLSRQPSPDLSQADALSALLAVIGNARGNNAITPHLAASLQKAVNELNAQAEQGSAANDDLCLPGRALWDTKDWQLRCPWNDDKLAMLRSRAFLCALRLHEWTIKSCAGECISHAANICACLRLLRTGGTVPPQVWDALFFMVPLVSSTLASFSRMFSGMDAGTLDWVFLDEAGQATPQSAAGALWRAKRAAVIGDPLQIEPVVQQPPSLLEKLRLRCEQDHIDLEPWSPATQSAQTLADRASILGTRMKGAGMELWTEFPLRAHHRCAEPMFTVANRVAYAGQMIAAGPLLPAVRSPLGESRWFNVHGKSSDLHLVHEEMDCLSACLHKCLYDWPQAQDKDGWRDAEIFIISPFRKVAAACHELLREMDLDKNLASCGTIHTFQGREADIVFLVLGSSPGKAGWGSRQWAAQKPNILNVAITRARSLLYVIGNIRDWQKHPFFSILAEEIPCKDYVPQQADARRLSLLFENNADTGDTA